MSNSELIVNAMSKGKSSSTSASQQKSGFYLNLGNPHRHGEPNWSVIETQATGLYGHVAALHENASSPPKLTAYKIEYWQLYAYDAVPGQTDCNKISNSHEGDWVGVELVVEPDQHTIRRVRHNIHSASVTFDLSQGSPVDIGNSVREYRGKGTGKPYSGYIDLNVKGPAGIGWAQNNLVRFFCDRDGCTHPLVYIEHGGHEAWPTEHWNWPVVYAHNGDSPHQYLVATPKNVGEIGHPMPGCLDCKLVVGYNGHWGACGSDPPEGPPVNGTGVSRNFGVWLLRAPCLPWPAARPNPSLNLQASAASACRLAQTLDALRVTSEISVGGKLADEGNLLRGLNDILNLRSNNPSEVFESSTLNPSSRMICHIELDGSFLKFNFITQRWNSHIGQNNHFDQYLYMHG